MISTFLWDASHQQCIIMETIISFNNFPMIFYIDLEIQIFQEKRLSQYIQSKINMPLEIIKLKNVDSHELLHSVFRISLQNFLLKKLLLTFIFDLFLDSLFFVIYTLSQQSKIFDERLMDCQENTIVFYHLSAEQQQLLNNQQIQASCQFQIRVCKSQQTGSINENSKHVLLQIRSNYLLECDIASQKFQSGVTLNYFLNFNLFDINREQKNNFITQTSYQTCYLNIWEENLNNPGSSEISEEKQFNQRTFQLICLNSQNFSHFKSVMLSKSIIFSLKGLNQDYKPVKILCTKENSKVFIGQRIYDGKKWQIQGQNIQNMKKHKIFKDLLSQLSILKKISHPNVQKIERVLRTKNTLYIVKKLYQTDLTEYSKFTRCGVENIRKIIKKILLAIQYLHKNFIVHSRVKTDNIALNWTQGNLTDIVITGFSNFCIFSPGHNQLLQFAQLKGRNKSKQQFQRLAQKDIEGIGLILYGLLLRKNQNPQHSFEYSKNEQYKYMIAQVQSMQQIPNNAIILLKELLGLSEKGMIDAKTALQNMFIKQYNDFGVGKVQQKIQSTSQNPRKDYPN